MSEAATRRDAHWPRHQAWRVAQAGAGPSCGFVAAALVDKPGHVADEGWPVMLRRIGRQGRQEIKPMGSVIASWSGHLVPAEAREGLLARLALLARAVAPGLGAVWTPIDEVIEPPIFVDLGDGEVPLAGPVRVQGGSLRLVDFRDWEHHFPFTFVVESPPGLRPPLRGRLVRVAQGDDDVLPEPEPTPTPTLVTVGAGHASISMNPSVDLRYQLEEEFDWLMAWIHAFHVPNLQYWRYRDQPGTEKLQAWLRKIEAMPPQERTFAQIFAKEDRRYWRHDPARPIPADVSAALEAEGTTEALTFGLIIELLRQTSRDWEITE